LNLIAPNEVPIFFQCTLLIFVKVGLSWHVEHELRKRNFGMKSVNCYLNTGRTGDGRGEWESLNNEMKSSLTGMTVVQTVTAMY